MDTKKYLLRSLRYILRMVVLLAVVFGVMALFGLIERQNGNLFEAIFVSRNGVFLLGVLIFLAGLYPRLSFGEVTTRGNIHSDRRKIKEVMAQYGYVVSREDETSMEFRAGRLSRRLLAQWDDGVTVTGRGDRLYIEGMKKDIFRLQGRLSMALDPED
ncbi:MAG: hypothetical protein LIO85_06895 [Rikenellaceae bacterium]|nr:hypothetical protein [Rikenellaceae bacterium]